MVLTNNVSSSNVFITNFKLVLNCQISLNHPFFYDISIGLKQGEPLSPLLFIRFATDIAENLFYRSLKDSDLELLSLYRIIFADDLDIFTMSPVNLLTHINSITKSSW